MNVAFGNAELQSFQTAIATRLGLRFDDGKLTFLGEVLTRRVEAQRVSAGSYLAALQAGLSDADELSALARELTVGETYFFRHAEQFNALRELALPERLAARSGSGMLRLLSAGCASGEEPYSLAILLRERGLEPSLKVTVQGFDLNPDSLKKATGGLYSPWALRETSVELKERWFTPEGRDFRLAKAIRDAVRFDRHNLIQPDPELLPPESYDVIFCRNVLMYFTPEHAASIVERLTTALAPGGFLFLGHAETLRGLSHSFHLRHTHNTFYYQRKDALVTTRLPDFERTTAELPPRPSDDRAWVGTWLETVERSSERIRALSNAAAAPAASSSVAGAMPAARSALSQPMELLRSERFGEALVLMQALSPKERADPAALLLRGALLTHQGELEPAEATCRELLELDDLNAGAHYLLALCFERRGELSAAVEEDLTAVYLDAGFAMPHLHLGLMARRRRDPDAARRELAQALLLLEREDASRLLLFGGGFSRNALLALCRSELENLRGGA